MRNATTEIEIHLLGKKLRLLQPAQGFRTSMDSVMLAAAVPAKAGDRVLDMGCGVGGAALCLMHRVPGLQLTGIDIQRDYIDMAARNAALNGMQGARFVHADIRAFTPETAERFDHVLCNPPFMEDGHHTPSPVAGKAAANGHLEEDADLGQWLDAAFRALKSRGTLTLIHRADRVHDIIQGLGRRFGKMAIIPLWPKAGEPASRVIIRCAKDRKSPAIIHSGIVLHEADGAHSAQADAVLRGESAIP